FRNGNVLGTFSVASWAFSGLGGRIGISCDLASAVRYDNFGGGNVVSGTNTPPVATILSPADGAFYYTGQTVSLSGSATDAQSPVDSLLFSWVVDLLHNNHVHPATITATGSTASFLGQNYDDGTGVHLLIKLAVTDPRGATSDTAKVFIWPETDLVPSALTLAPDPPVVGQSTHITCTLAN